MLKMKNYQGYVQAGSARVTAAFRDRRSGRASSYIALTALLCACAALPLSAQTGWQEEVRLTIDEAISFTPPNNGKCVTVDHDGNVHIVWADERDRNFEIYHAMRSNGMWQNERVSFHDERSARPVLAVDDIGRMHLVWNDSRDGNKEIYHRFLNGSWSAETRVSDTAGDSFGSSCVTDGLKLHLVYHEMVSDHLEIMYRVFDFFVWSDATQLTGVPTGNRKVPSIAIDPEGSLHVAWWDTRENSLIGQDNHIYYRRKTDQWLAEELVSSPGSKAMRPNIATDDSGYVHVVWINNTGGFDQIGYRRRGPSGWEPEVIITSGDNTHYHPSITVSGNDVYMVYWSNEFPGNNSEVFFTRRIPDGWMSPQRISNGAGPSTLCCLIADQNRNLHCAWVDERDGNMEIYYSEYLNPETGVGDTYEPRFPDIPPVPLSLTALPNPFRHSTTITLSVPAECGISLRIFDVRGRCVRNLVRSRRAGGSHRCLWDGRDNLGRDVSPGVYIVMGHAGKRRISSKILLLR